MSGLYAVTRSRGPAWKGSLPLERQPGWRAHADFMNGLERDGFVVLGGPLEGTPDTLLIIRAGSPEEIRDRLARDPWGPDMLRLERVIAWDLRLGSLG